MGAYAEQIKTRRTSLQRLTNDTKTLYADMEQRGSDKVTADERTKLDNMINDGMVQRKELDQLIELDLQDDIVNAPVNDRKVRNGINIDLARSTKTWGEKVVESKQYKNNDGKNMQPVEVRAAAIQSDADNAQGGHLVRADRLAEIIDIARNRQPTLINLYNQSGTVSDSVEFIRMISRTIGAAVVPETTGTGDTRTGTLKPQSDIQFDLQSAPVKTIAAWIAATRQILMDAPRLRDTIDNELLYELSYVLEDQTVNGNGTGNNFVGILSTPNIQLRTMHATTPVGRGQTTTDTRMTTLRKAITDIRLGFYEVDGIALNPVDAETLELAEYGANRYMMAFDPVQMRVWRVPVVETHVLATNTAIVGAWRLGATLWDRLQTEIRVSENVNDDFLRNMVRVLGELRAAFAVTRPQAFERVNMI